MLDRNEIAAALLERGADVNLPIAENLAMKRTPGTPLMLAAYAETPNPALVNLLLDKFFKKAVSSRQAGWRRVVVQATRLGIPVPCLGSALSYFDAQAKLSTWIYTIAHRVAIDHLRKTGRCREESLTPTDDSETGVLSRLLGVRLNIGRLVCALRRAETNVPKRYRQQ